MRPWASDGPFLNDCLYFSPNLLSKIFYIFTRFQISFIAILTGIKQAFSTIEISKKHRDFLHFLRYENVNSGSDAKLKVQSIRPEVFIKKAFL